MGGGSEGPGMLAVWLVGFMPNGRYGRVVAGGWLEVCQEKQRQKLANLQVVISVTRWGMGGWAGVKMGG